MQWADLRTHGDTPHHAFEALCSQLFERWCLSEFKDIVERFYVTGAGGDGGVESIAQLKGGSSVGLQCKWFRDPLKAGEFGQIKKSLATAARLRGGLTTYVVAIPRNLADGVDDVDSKTERQRWEAFVATARRDHPQVKVELWDEYRIETLLGSLGSEGIRRYWFSKNTVDLARLKRLFKQARDGWLADRYFPDLHKAGEIEREVELRANRAAFPVHWSKWFAGLAVRLRDALQALRQLAHVKLLSGCEELAEAERATRELAKYAQALNCTLSGPPNPSIAHSLRAPCFNVAPLLARLKAFPVAEATRPHRDAISRLCDHLDDQPFSDSDFVQLQRPAVFTAGAGAGKTHACAHIVKRALDRDEPALVIRARDFTPKSDNWTAILLRSLEEQGQSLEELLDALLAAARLVDVRHATPGEVRAPCRPIILLDGLDESPGAFEWSDRLRELPASIGNRRVVLAVTARTSLIRDRLEGAELQVISIEQSDPDLHQLLETYLQISRIEAPPVLRWWLRSPLAVRLFADVFAGARRQDFADLSLGIHELVRRKIALVAASAAELLGVSPDLAVPLVRARLIDFGQRLLANGGPLSNHDALACLRGSGPTAIAEPLRVLQVFRDRGVLIEIPSFEADPLRDNGPTWDFAFETLHSYVIASSYADNPRAEALPYLRTHPQALTFSIVMREDAGLDMLCSNEWSHGLPEIEAMEIRLAALSLMRRDRASAYTEYVRTLLMMSMPCCRLVIDALIFPGLRISGYPFGARFVFDAIGSLAVAERDKFWSGPSRLARVDGHPWEGVGRKAFEGQSIARDDSWDSAPLLLLLSCASVDENHRRYIVYQLARWGATNPAGITELARLVFGSFNDPQVLQDLSNAMWSASCLMPEADWSALCEIISNGMWGNAFPHVPSLLFLRYCELFLTLTGGAKRSLRLAMPDVLPLDPAVGSAVNKETGFGPIHGDFTWYIVPSALRVFESADNYWGDRPSDQLAGEWQWSREARAILTAFIEGRIRTGAPQERIDDARQYLEGLDREPKEGADRVTSEQINSAESNLACGKAGAAVAGDASDSADRPGDAAEENALDDSALHEPEDISSLSGASQDSSRPKPPWEAGLRQLLALHAERCGLSSLTLRAFAFGYIMARAAELGWTPELRSADRAIRNAYERKTQTSRSSICSFFEKYLWIALGELRTFLSRRLAIADPKGLSPDNIEDAENPIDRLDFVSCHIKVSRWHALVKPTELTETWAQERANEWVRTADPVIIEDVAFFNGVAGHLHESVDILMAGDENVSWVALNGFLHVREPTCEADRLVWLSSVLVDREDLELIEEDARAGLLLQQHDLDDARAGLHRRGHYVGPFEALWMSDAEQDNAIAHATVVLRNGELMRTELFLHAAIAKSHWADPKERTFVYPTKALREALGITFYKNGGFFRGDRELVIASAEMKREVDDGWDPPRGEWLLFREDFLQEALRSLNMALLIAMQARTEPAPHLKEHEIGWERIEQRSMIVLDGTGRRKAIEFVERIVLPSEKVESVKQPTLPGPAIDARDLEVPQTKPQGEGADASPEAVTETKKADVVTKSKSSKRKTGSKRKGPTRRNT